MQVSIEASDGLERTLKVVVPSADVKKKENEIIHKIAKNRRMPGFRPGKIPFNVVAKECADEIKSHMIQELVEANIYKAIVDANIERLAESTPVVSDIGEPNSDKDFSFILKIEVEPEVNLDNLGDCEINKKVLSLGDDDVNLMIENIRKCFCTYNEKEGTASKGDKVEVVFEEVENGDPKVFNRKLAVELDPENNPSFINDYIRDKKVGDVVEFTRKDQDENGEHDVAFKFTVKSIQQAILPEVNEEFMKKVNPEGDPQNFRQDLLKNIERELSSFVEQTNMNNVFTKLAEMYKDIELPARAVEETAKRIKQSFAQRKDVQVTDEQIKNRAEYETRFYIIFKALVKKFNLHPDENVVLDYAKRVSSAYENADEYLKQLLTDRRRMEAISNRCWQVQVANHVLTVVKTVEEPLGFKEYTQTYAA